MLHNPSKLDNVPALLLKYKGHERELLDELCRQYELDNPEGQIVKLVSMVEDDLANTEDIRWTINEGELVEQYLYQRHPDDYNPREGEPFVLTGRGSHLPCYWYEAKYHGGN